MPMINRDLNINKQQIIPRPTADGEFLSSNGKSWEIKTVSYRKKLSSNTNYYVRTDGNDSNDGLSNTASSAFLTIQKAVDTVCSIDTGGYDVNINIANGTYTDSVVLYFVIGGGNANIIGNTSSPSSVVVSTTSASCFYGESAGVWNIRGIKVQASSSGNCFWANKGSIFNLQNIVFGSVASSPQAYAHIYAMNYSTINVQSSYTISGGAGYHMSAFRGSVINNDNTANTISANYAITYFASSYELSILNCANSTWTGSSITGTRYFADKNSGIYVGTGSATYFPGNVAGSVANKSVYV